MEHLTVDSDMEVRQIAEQAHRKNEAIPPLKLRGGDLAKTLGITSENFDTSRALTNGENEFVCDMGSVLLDGLLHFFVAHLIIWHKKPNRFSGYFCSVMNASWLGNLNLAPKAHPGDQKLDLLTAQLAPREAREFKKRAVTGTHILHPSVKLEKITTQLFEFEKPRAIFLDGVEMPKSKNLLVKLEPAALKILI